MGKAVPEGRDGLHRYQDQSGSTIPGQERRGVKRDSEVCFLMNRRNYIKKLKGRDKFRDMMNSV